MQMYELVNHTPPPPNNLSRSYLLELEVPPLHPAVIQLCLGMQSWVAEYGWDQRRPVSQDHISRLYLRIDLVGPRYSMFGFMCVWACGFCKQFLKSITFHYGYDIIFLHTYTLRNWLLSCLVPQCYIFKNYF